MILERVCRAKWNREAQKLTHFDAFWHVTRWGVFFSLAKEESIFFHAHFASNLDAFSVIFAWFDTRFPSKVKPGSAKTNAFWRILARHALACIFCACESGIHVFACSFCVGFGRVLGPLCTILGTRPITKPRSTNGPWRSSNYVIFIIFWNVFDTQKIELKPTFCELSEKWI